MDAMQYLDLLEARLQSQNTDGRLDRVIARLDAVADSFRTLHQEDASGVPMPPHIRLMRIAELMTEVSGCMDEFLAEED